MKKILFLIFFYSFFSFSQEFENFNDTYLKNFLLSAAVGFAGEIIFYKSEEVTPRILLSGSTVACVCVDNLKIAVRQNSADSLGLIQPGSPDFKNIYGAIFSGIGVCSGIAFALVLKKFIFKNYVYE